jgi:hypothetical protein
MPPHGEIAILTSSIDPGEETVAGDRVRLRPQLLAEIREPAVQSLGGKSESD